MNTTENGDVSDLDAEIYQGALSSKHHYDTLSWVIGGVVLLFFASLIKEAGDACSPSRRLLLVIASMSMLLGWFLIYQRNSYWGEVANETLKAIERRHRKKGLAIRHMEAAVPRERPPRNNRRLRWKNSFLGLLPGLRYELDNHDENGEPWAANGLAWRLNVPMHRVISWGCVLLGILAVLYVYC
jgi:hypothetical protein